MGVDIKVPPKTDGSVAEVVRDHWLPLSLIAAAALVLIWVVKEGFKSRTEVKKAKIEADSQLRLTAQQSVMFREMTEHLEKVLKQANRRN
jgi:hypothetical protein